MTRQSPSNFGRYNIIRELGRGAMGVVYKAHDTVIGRMVAVKTINVDNPGSGITKQEAINFFFREAKIVGKLSHPNITGIYDVGVDKDTHFIVIEFVKGRTLEQVIEGNEHPSLLEKLKIMENVARAVNYAHARNVVHRDIKPGNIMLGANNEPKVMDFGLAMMNTGSLLDKIETEKVLGTPHYMSPEQIKGAYIDQQSDIFSLGATAYEFISGSKPFDGESMKDVLLGALYNDPRPMSIANESIPGEVDEIISKALAKDKANRYKSAGQMADALGLYINKLENASGLCVNVNMPEEKQKIINALRGSYVFFSGFDDNQLLEILKLSTKEKFAPGHVIFEEGSLGDKMFIILEGEVEIFKLGANSEKVEIAIIEKGDCFGEMAIIDNSPRSASAMALSDTEVVVLNEIVLRVTLPELCVKLYKNLASAVSEKLRQSNIKLREILENNQPPLDT